MGLLASVMSGENKLALVTNSKLDTIKQNETVSDSTLLFVSFADASVVLLKSGGVFSDTSTLVGIVTNSHHANVGVPKPECHHRERLVCFVAVVVHHGLAPLAVDGCDLGLACFL